MNSPRIFTATVGALALLSATILHAADPATMLLNEAKAAYQQGNIDVAKAKFESVRQLDPKNPAAIAYLHKIHAQEAERGPGVERALEKLVVPSVQFKEAELSAVLDALRQQAAKLTDGKLVLNFVTQLPEEQTHSLITMSLKNIPMSELMKYVGNLTGVNFVYDKYAIVVQPAGTAKVEPAPAAGTP